MEQSVGEDKHIGILREILKADFKITHEVVSLNGMWGRSFKLLKECYS